MKDIVITSDSTCDLSADLLTANEIAIMPLSVMLGDRTYKDGIDIMPSDIFRYVDETGELPKTAAPSVEEYERFFRSFTDEGKTVIHFNISSKACGSWICFGCRSKNRRFACLCGRFARSVYRAGIACSESVRSARSREICGTDLPNGLIAARKGQYFLYSRYAAVPLQGRTLFDVVLLRGKSALHPSDDRHEGRPVISEEKVYRQNDSLHSFLYQRSCCGLSELRQNALFRHAQQCRP